MFIDHKEGDLESLITQVPFIKADATIYQLIQSLHEITHNGLLDRDLELAIVFRYFYNRRPNCLAACRFSLVQLFRLRQYHSRDPNLYGPRALPTGEADAKGGSLITLRPDIVGAWR